MMQRTLAMMLAVLLSISGILSLAEHTDHTYQPDESEISEEEIFWLQGVVTQIDSDAILFTASTGRYVKAKLNEKTLMQDDEPVQIGDWVQIAYNGMMSASLRGQISAMQVICHHLVEAALTGVITGVPEVGLLLSTSDGELTIAVTDETLLAVQPEVGMSVRVVLQDDGEAEKTGYTAKLVIPD